MKTKLLIITAMLGISTLASCSPTGTSVNPVNSSENSISEVSSSSSSEENSSEEFSEEVISSSSSGESSSEASSEEEIINYSKDINDYYGGYYSSLSSWTNGEDLKQKLHNIISSNINKLKYSGNWVPNSKADVSQISFDLVDEVYSSDYNLVSNTTANNNSSGWDREHAFCQSLMGHSVSDEGDTGGVSTDFHNLFASNGSGNRARGNKNFGEAGDGTINYVSTTDIFEPADEDKGRLSRALLYMDTCYDDLTLIDGIADSKEVKESKIGKHGNKDIIISWADSFDVNYQEYQHNQRIYELQNNRNPYVDFPELIDYVYGTKKDEAGTIENVLKSSSQVKLHTDEKRFKNLAISNAAYKFRVGDKFTSSDIKVYETYTDLTNAEIENKEGVVFSIPDNYEFAVSDIGKKYIKVSKGDEEINYPVTVLPYDETQDYAFNYELATSVFNGKNGVFKINGVDFNITYEGRDTTIKAELDANKGIHFGSSAHAIKTLTIESVEDFTFDNKTKISDAIIKGCCASGANVNVEVKVGNNSLGIKKFGTADEYNEYKYSTETPYSGKLIINVTNTTKKAFYIHDISINVVD